MELRRVAIREVRAETYLVTERARHKGWRHWWVNQNQTYRQEIGGGYMWSPKVNENGKLNPFYEYMREVAPGDLMFSFADTLIKAVGIATSPCYACPKPPEFGPAGKVWGQSGWRVGVRWLELKNQIKPAQHMATIAMYLAENCSRQQHLLPRLQRKQAWQGRS